MPQPETINVDELADEITVRVRALPDPNVPNVRRIRREISRRIAGAETQQVITLALRLVDEPGLDWVAYELAHHHKEALKSLYGPTLGRFGRGINSWSTVDPFAVYLAGPAWRERQVPDSLILGWARSENRWWRRTALVSSVALNNKARGGSGDVARTIDVCRVLAVDHDDMVVKALSWALRELVKHDQDAVRRFLAEHHHSLAARVKREVTNKLNTGLKNP